MNEDQAAALFAPARERPVPPADFAMADVFAQAALARRRRRLAAALTSAVAVLVVVLGIALLTTGGSHQSAPASHPTDLLSLVRAVPLPADATALTPQPLPSNDTNEQQPGYVAQQQFWTTAQSPKAALARMTSRAPLGLTPDGTSYGTTNGLSDVSAFFTAAETRTVDGPHLSLDAQTQADGRTELVVLAWQVVKPAKTADETVTGTVTSATMSSLLGSATVTGTAAQQLATDLNALWVTVAGYPHGCSGDPSQLTFGTDSSTRTFTVGCGRVLPVPTTHQPQLETSAALGNDLVRLFPGLVAAPVASTPPAPALSDLARVLDQLPAPDGSTGSTTPPVAALANVVGIANGDDLQTQTRYWTSTMARDATVTWLSQHLPSRWRGSFSLTAGDQRVGVYSGPATPTEYGPNLEITVVATPTGSAYRVDVSEQPLAAKSAAEHLSGVTGVTLLTRDAVAPTDQPPLQSVHLGGVKAQQLADDVNALVVRRPGRRGCTAGSLDVLLDFATAAGHTEFLDNQNCGFVTLLRGSGPGLGTSGPLYDDVTVALKAGAGPTRGTLIASITTSASHGQPVAGTITVHHRGATTTRQVGGDQSMVVTEPVGAYTITAFTDTATCTPGAATVRPGQQTDVDIVCH